MWDKMKVWFRHSATIVWARAIALAGVVLAALESVLADPSITAGLQQVLQPKFVPYYVIAIGLVTELARRRTAGKS